MKRNLFLTMNLILLFSLFLNGQGSIEIYHFNFLKVKGNKTDTVVLKDADRDFIKSADSTKQAFIVMDSIDKSVNIKWTCHGNPGILDKKNNSMSFDVINELKNKIGQGPGKTIIINKGDKTKTAFATFYIKLNKELAKKGPVPSKESTLLSFPFTFLPNPGDFQNFQVNKPASGSGEVRENEYRIIYDFKNKTLNYPRAWLGGAKKKVTNINKNIVFEVINVNPLIHQVTINNSVVNRNTELESQFSNIMVSKFGFSGKDTTSKKESTGDLGKETEISEMNLLQTYKTLAAELLYFYTKKIAEPSPDMHLFRQELDFIELKISQVLKMTTTADFTSLMEKGAEDMKTVKNDSIRNGIGNEVQKAANLLEKLESVNFSMVSNPIEPGNNDEFDLSLSIKKGDADAVPPANYSVMMCGGWKVDFSAGFYLTGMVDKLFALQTVSTKDTTFASAVSGKKDSIVSIRNVDKQKIVRDDKGNNFIGMMILSHIYPRTGYRVNVSLTTGFGLDMGLNARYLLGGSLLLGYEKRWVFTGGCIWGNTKTLASGLVEGQYYSGNSDQIHKDVFNHSWFVSVSFNIGSVSLPNKSNKK